MVLSQKKSGKRKKKINPFRRAVLRGLGILLPPLLTIAIFLWIGNTIADRLLEPLEDLARWAFVETADIQPVGNTHLDPLGLAQIDGANYHVAADNRLVPLKVYDKVASHIGQQVIAKATAEEIYLNYINTEWLRREYVVPVFLSFFSLKPISSEESKTDRLIVFFTTWCGKLATEHTNKVILIFLY